MMGETPPSEALFYYFRLEDHIPENHLLRLIDRYIDLRFVRERLRSFYSDQGRPSIDPEVLLRMMLIGYLYGITSDRRLVEEVRMHLAYRWFTRLGFDQEVPDHSTFSKNRHGRFRESEVFRGLFEEIVRRCIAEGLVEGQRLSVDGTLIAANASQGSRVPKEALAEAAKVSRTVQEYLQELDAQNPAPASESPAKEPTPGQSKISTTDPDAAWARKRGPAGLAYYDNYLIDNASRVILDVEATPALLSQEIRAAERMVGRIKRGGLSPESLGADKAYGTGEFFAWLLERGIQPHIPILDREYQKRERVTREQFRYEPLENAYYCPQGKKLRYRGTRRNSRQHDAMYTSTAEQCRGCPIKMKCISGAFRHIYIHPQQSARDAVSALVGTPAYVRSRRERPRIEALFAELKHRMGMGRVRLRRLWNVTEQFLLAATAQNIKRLVKFLVQKQPLVFSTA